MVFPSPLNTDTLLLSGGRLLVVDGDSQRVTVEGKPCKCYGQYY